MKILIAGNGKTLYFISRKFISKGHDVVIINPDRNECVQLSRQFGVTVVCGNGSDPEILREAGAMSADVVLAITSKDQDNLIICQLASVQYGVPRTVAMANDPDNAEIFEKLGTTAFSTTQIVASLIEQCVSLEQVINMLPVGEGRVNVAEIIIDAGFPVVGKSLKDIDLPKNTLIGMLIRGNQLIVPHGENQLMPRDRAVLISLPENLGPALKILTGEKR